MSRTILRRQEVDDNVVILSTGVIKKVTRKIQLNNNTLMDLEVTPVYIEASKVNSDELTIEAKKHYRRGLFIDMDYGALDMFFESLMKAQTLISELFIEVVQQLCEAVSQQETDEILNRLEILSQQIEEKYTYLVECSYCHDAFHIRLGNKTKNNALKCPFCSKFNALDEDLNKRKSSYYQPKNELPALKTRPTEDRPPQEKYEQCIQYDYFDEDGRLFRTVAKNLEEAREKRDQWLENNLSPK